MPVNNRLTPEPAQQVIVLNSQRNALLDVFAKPGIDWAGISAAEHEVYAAVSKVLQKGVVLRDLYRVIGSNQRGGSR